MPDISLVDFTAPYDICGFVSQLCQVGENLGMSKPNYKPTRETNRIRHLADKVVRKLDDVMPGMSVADAFMVTSAYDLAHRFAYATPADHKLLNRYILGAFDSMIHGDKSVDEYAMHQAISQAIRRRDPAYFDKPLIWLTITDERWYNEAKRGFDTTTLSDYDIISRVSILLRTDLTAYEGRNQAQFKQTLASRHRHNLDSHVPLP